MFKIDRVKEGIEVGYDTNTIELDFICEYCSHYNDYHVKTILKDFKYSDTTSEVVKSLRNVTSIKCLQCGKHNKVIGTYVIL